MLTLCCCYCCAADDDDAAVALLLLRSPATCTARAPGSVCVLLRAVAAGCLGEDVAMVVCWLAGGFGAVGWLAVCRSQVTK